MKVLKVQPPPPPAAEIKAPKRGQNGQKSLKSHCGYEGDPKNISSYKPDFFLVLHKKSSFLHQKSKSKISFPALNRPYGSEPFFLGAASCHGGVGGSIGPIASTPVNNFRPSRAFFCLCIRTRVEYLGQEGWNHPFPRSIKMSTSSTQLKLFCLTPSQRANLKQDGFTTPQLFIIYQKGCC